MAGAVDENRKRDSGRSSPAKECVGDAFAISMANTFALQASSQVYRRAKLMTAHNPYFLQVIDMSMMKLTVVRRRARVSGYEPRTPHGLTFKGSLGNKIRRPAFTILPNRHVTQARMLCRNRDQADHTLKKMRSLIKSYSRNQFHCRCRPAGCGPILFFSPSSSALF